ncbi:MAG TPA: Rieske 2Fe-2S domain-containing protein [Nocardia sp.]|uniref:Rieske (2Fe-2S) protein n=1 Tax=Nocardia TaxID=1817 RepID=UPI002454FC19|nr:MULTISPECIES: Rieske 2Fe-2S domain-containing protein [Nocardia]HLS79013.1 Rieske 2Fe-2S domain-containing protein [Nocardia sp.]
MCGSEQARPASAATQGGGATSPGTAAKDGQARLAQGREHVVARVDEIPPGEHKVVPIGRHGVGVYNVGGAFYAIANYCPHEGGPLCAGRTRGRTVVDESVPGDAVMVRDKEFVHCPWHQWGFELATGTTAVKPEWSIRTYPVRVVGDSVVVQA